MFERYILYSLINNPQTNGTFGEMIVKSMFESKFYGPDERYLVNNIYFEDVDGTHQIDHILILQKGIFVIETKHINGKITINENGNWVATYGPKVFEMIDPIKQNDHHCKVVKAFMHNQYNVHSVIVFTTENKPQGVADFVVNFSKLKQYLHNLDTGENISSEEMKQINDWLTTNKQECTVTPQEHIDNIKNKK